VFQLNWKSRKSPFRRCFKPGFPIWREHTTTGTCEIGGYKITGSLQPNQAIFVTLRLMPNQISCAVPGLARGEGKFI
jgi:hypothetical protein